jgi:diguanylate cyclase (GGDEF)-like protein
MTHGESLGVLHLRRSHPAAELEQDLAGETGYALAEAVADHIALNLGNLRLREILRLQSIHDPLTGLFNRRYLEESMTRELSRASRDRYAVGVIVLDIDHFKHFNDAYGHDAGDAVLTDIGALLRNGIRGGDIPCRYGGEEFIAILPGAPIEATWWRAEQLRQSIERHRVTHRDRLLDPVTVSLGVAIYPDHGETFEELFRAADTALYEAKSDGRNRVKAAPSLNEEAADVQGGPSVTARP